MSFFAGAVVGKAFLDTAGWSSGANAMGKSMSGVTKIVTAAGAAITAALVKATLDANEFQKSMSNVSTLVDTSQVNVQGMAKELLTMDSALGSAQDLTNGLYQALSASVAPAQAVEFVGKSAQFAKAALIDTNTAVDVITSGLNAYGYEADQAGRISDVLFQTIKAGKTTGAELSSTIGQVIPLAANMNLSFENLGASIAIMTRQGINSANATTQLNAVMTSLLKPSGELQEAMRAAGFETGEAVTSSEDFQAALQKVIAQTDGSQEALAALFPNTRALRGALALTGEGAADFAGVLDDMNKSAGATEEAFNKQEKTFDTFKQTAERVSIVVGNISKRFVDELAVGATEAANGMLKFILSSQGAEVIGNIIGFLAGGFEALKTGMQPIVDVLGPAIEGIWTALTEAMGELTGKTDDSSSSFAVLGKTIAFTTAIIEILGDGIRLVIRLAGNLVDVFLKLVDVNVKFIEALADPLNPEKWKAFGDSAVAVGDSFVELFTEVAEDGASLFNTLGEKILTFDQEAEKNAKNIEIAYTTSFTRTSEGVVANWDDMTTGMQNYVDGVVQGMQTAEDAVTETNDNIEGDTDDTLKSLAESWKDYLEGLKEEQRSWFEVFTDIGENALDTIGSGLSKAFEDMVTAMKQGEDAGIAFWTAMKDAAKEAVAVTLEALGKEFALRAAVALIPKPFPQPIVAAGWAAASVAAFAAAGVVRALESGGSFNAREPIMVGEAGPEILVPNIAGTIIPNSSIGGGVTFYNNFSVRDDSDIEKINRKLGMQFKSTNKRIGQG